MFEKSSFYYSTEIMPLTSSFCKFVLTIIKWVCIHYLHKDFIIKDCTLIFFSSFHREPFLISLRVTRSPTPPPFPPASLTFQRSILWSPRQLTPRYHGILTSPLLLFPPLTVCTVYMNHSCETVSRASTIELVMAS